MLRIIGITGVMGSGKSFCSNIFSEFGALLFNTDVMARKVQMQNTNLRDRLEALFGKEYFNGNDINTEYVKSLLFAGTDESYENLKTVTNLVGKYVMVELAKYIENLEASGIDNTYVLVESAILFETGFDKMCSLNIGVKAPNPVKATFERSLITEEEWHVRMKTQLPDSEKKFDFIIGNDYTADVRKQIENIHNEILKICQ